MTRRDLADPELHELIDAVAGAPHPEARLVQAPRHGMQPPFAVLAGSFDPMTTAHAALAYAALRRDVQTVLLAIAVRTIGKEGRAVFDLATRLRSLASWARRRQRIGVLVCNRGLYLEQARALRRLGVERPLFLVGSDKLPQIFDPYYYANRDAELRDLFSLASFLVVPRDGNGAPDPATFMSLPEQRAYAGGVGLLRLSAGEQRRARGVSSSRVRDLRVAGLDWHGLVPRDALVSLTRRKSEAPPNPDREH